MTRGSTRDSAPVRRNDAADSVVLQNKLARWDLYRLLSDPTRLRLLALASVEELAVSELAELLGQGQPKVSRQASMLREAGLLWGRKQGTWLLLRLPPNIDADSVVSDALRVGMELCTTDGSAARIADVVAARDAATRVFFGQGGRAERAGPPDELAAYLGLLAPLIAPRELAIDAGTGDGALLEVLAPLFDQVIALDRSSAQLDLARKRTARRQLHNVRFVCGEIDGPEIREAIVSPSCDGNDPPRRAAPTSRSRSGEAQNGLGADVPVPQHLGADAVCAARVLHHAPIPSQSVVALSHLARPPVANEPGGGIFVLDYEAHRDEALREQQADLWLGFDPEELRAMAHQAGLCDIAQGRFPEGWCGKGPDQHITWPWLTARRGTRG